MINAELLKQYNRQLALYCLQSVAAPLTAAECAELMQTTALNSMHDDECWKRIDAGKVAGTLKALFNAGCALEAEPVRNGRQGRDQARWAQNPDSERVELPDCPGEIRLSPPPGMPQVLTPTLMGLEPYAHLSREQLIALVAVQDDLAVLINDWQTKLNEWKARARSLLAGAEHG